VKVNKNLLKSKMILNNDSNKTLASKLKITEGSMSNKINSKNKFTPEEMNFIREDYNLTDVEFIDMFFKNK
jgi:hypothetical protein